MNPIPPIGAAAADANRPVNMPEQAGGTRQTPAAGLSPGRDAGPSNQVQQLVNQLDRVLAHLLDPTRHGGQNEQLLRLLIGLLILAALLNALEGETSQPQPDPLAALAQNGGGGGEGMYMSATSITIEQTVTTVTMQSVEGYFANDSANTPESGSRIDLAA